MGVVASSSTWPCLCTGTSHLQAVLAHCVSWRACCRYLEAESEMEKTYRLKQKDLARGVDVTSAGKVGGRGSGIFVLPLMLYLPHSVF